MVLFGIKSKRTCLFVLSYAHGRAQGTVRADGNYISALTKDKPGRNPKQRMKGHFHKCTQKMIACCDLDLVSKIWLAEQL